MMGQDPITAAIDRASQKLPEILLNGAQALLVSLFRPLATLTESFYMQDMGERYYTPWNFVGGSALLLFAFSPAVFSDYAPPPLGMSDVYFGALPILAHRILVGAWICWLLARCVWQFIAAARRDARGERLHSYSCGRTPKNFASPTAYACFFALLGIVLIVPHAPWSLPPAGLVFIFSAWASLNQRSNEKRIARNRMLDTLDAQIEQDNMARAVIDKLPKDQTEGLGVPMRASVSQKIRKDFVRGMVGTDFVRPANKEEAPALAGAA